MPHRSSQRARALRMLSKAVVVMRTFGSGWYRARAGPRRDVNRSKPLDIGRRGGAVPAGLAPPLGQWR